MRKGFEKVIVILDPAPRGSEAKDLGRRFPKGVLILSFLATAAIVACTLYVKAAPTPSIVFPSIQIEGKPLMPQNYPISIRVLMLLTTLSLAPYILMMMTSFVRISIVLSFIRSAMGTQQTPPTQVLMGLALFLTFYVMAPVGKQINAQAIQPLSQGKISESAALQAGIIPERDFMLRQVQPEDLRLFYDLAKLGPPKTKADIPLYVLVPAFMVSEVKIGFEMGFLIYLPFLVIDMVVASVLMGMGMFMLSPGLISMPFKLLLFVMVDGWELIIKGLLLSFH